MQPVNLQRLTRVIVDGADLDIAELGAIAARIERALVRIPADQRAAMAAALLHVAVARVVTPTSSSSS